MRIRIIANRKKKKKKGGCFAEGIKNLLNSRFARASAHVRNHHLPPGILPASLSSFHARLTESSVKNSLGNAKQWWDLAELAPSRLFPQPGNKLLARRFPSAVRSSIYQRLIREFVREAHGEGKMVKFWRNDPTIFWLG